MKNLYNKGTVHPTPPFISDQLSFLPAAIFTLTLALSPDDREVLAYLLSCSSNNYANIKNLNNKKNKNNSSIRSSSRGCYSNGNDHATSFNCSCFRCYMSFWVRWDGSPNRQLIHEIIDAFEEGLTQTHQMKKEKMKKERRRKGNRNKGNKGIVGSGELNLVKPELSLEDDIGKFDLVDSSIANCDQISEREELEKGSIRRFVNFVGEKILGVWNLVSDNLGRGMERTRKGLVLSYLFSPILLFLL